jgi:hypothetical protein
MNGNRRATSVLLDFQTSPTMGDQSGRSHRCPPAAFAAGVVDHKRDNPLFLKLPQASDQGSGLARIVEI